MERLRATFETCFGFPFPEAILPTAKLFPVVPDPSRGREWARKGWSPAPRGAPPSAKGYPENALMWATRLAAHYPLLIQGDIGPLLERAPEGYFLFGFWGHGVNSYAFYYVRADSWRRIFFRLAFGGVYMDNSKRARQVREFLLSYFDFEEALAGKVKTLIAVESMGWGEYRIVMPDGQTFAHRPGYYNTPEAPSLFKHPAFWKVFGPFLRAQGVRRRRKERDKGDARSSGKSSAVRAPRGS